MFIQNVDPPVPSTLQLSFFMEFHLQMTIWLQVQDQSDLLLVHQGHQLLPVLQLLLIHLLVQSSANTKLQNGRNEAIVGVDE